jgi:hypothetical protein
MAKGFSMKMSGPDRKPLQTSNIKHQTSNIKQDNNSPVCESQDVPYACIIRRIDSIQATLARMATILNSEPEQKVQS